MHAIGTGVNKTVMKWQGVAWILLLIALFGLECLEAQTVRRYGPLTVDKAQYGKRGAQVDVTDRVRNLIRDNSLDFFVNSDTLGGDPSPDVNKELRLTYSYLGAKHTIVLKEGARCRVP
jgi:hypothetical protein